MYAIIHHAGHRVVVPASEWQKEADRMVATYGPWNPPASRIEMSEVKPESDWANQTTDAEARDRIERTHKALAESGVTVETSKQLYTTGTRMAGVGYANQRARAIEHAKKAGIKDVAAELSAIVRAEDRRDVVVTAGEIGAKLSVNGALTFDGLKLREQAVRGLLGRLGSPALRYVLGLRDRIADPDATPVGKQMDREALADVMQRECKRFGDVRIKLRTRQGLGDIFASVSPDYAPADAPEVLSDVVRALPSDARGSFSYDPATTTWEVRASVFTPTPIEEQAVGEAFEGYQAFGSRDNGTRRLTGGGGILLIACLNATTYQANGHSVSRVHRGNIMYDLRAMTRDAGRAIHALVNAWGEARGAEVETFVPIEVAVPGFYRHMLTARRGELVGILPGRTETHVAGLAKAFGSERRDLARVVRADLANGWTRYVQDMPGDVRRDAEAGIGRWIVGQEPVKYLEA